MAEYNWPVIIVGESSRPYYLEEKASKERSLFMTMRHLILLSYCVIGSFVSSIPVENPAHQRNAVQANKVSSQVTSAQVATKTRKNNLSYSQRAALELINRQIYEVIQEDKEEAKAHKELELGRKWAKAFPDYPFNMAIKKQLDAIEKMRKARLNLRLYLLNEQKKCVMNQARKIHLNGDLDVKQQRLYEEYKAMLKQFMSFFEQVKRIGISQMSRTGGMSQTKCQSSTSQKVQKGQPQCKKIGASQNSKKIQMSQVHKTQSTKKSDHKNMKTMASKNVKQISKKVSGESKKSKVKKGIEATEAKRKIKESLKAKEKSESKKTKKNSIAMKKLSRIEAQLREIEKRITETKAQTKRSSSSKVVVVRGRLYCKQSPRSGSENSDEHGNDTGDDEQDDQNNYGRNGEDTEKDNDNDGNPENGDYNYRKGPGDRDERGSNSSGANGVRESRGHNRDNSTVSKKPEISRDKKNVESNRSDNEGSSKDEEPSGKEGKEGNVKDGKGNQSRSEESNKSEGPTNKGNGDELNKPYIDSEIKTGKENDGEDEKPSDPKKDKQTRAACAFCPIQTECGKGIE